MRIKLVFGGNPEGVAPPSKVLASISVPTLAPRTVPGSATPRGGTVLEQGAVPDAWHNPSRWATASKVCWPASVCTPNALLGTVLMGILPLHEYFWIGYGVRGGNQVRKAFLRERVGTGVTKLATSRAVKRPELVGADVILAVDVSLATPRAAVKIPFAPG
jgi:hypothetical protein